MASREDPASPSDDALVAAIQVGDPTVASSLCHRLWPRVSRTVQRLVGHADVDRDDLGQMALVELVRSIGRYRGDCSLEKWAQTITAYVVFRHLRRRRFERRLFARPAEDGIRSADGARQGERQSAARQILGRIWRELEQMDRRRAWAYVLHDLVGYDLREVAQAMDCSLAAAQSRVVRGRRHLHERLGRDSELVEMLRKPAA